MTRMLARIGHLAVPFAVFAAGALAVGCIVDPGPSTRDDRSVTPAPTSTAPTPPPTTTPAKVSVDVGKTLVASPGDGAGIFITYAGSGHWNLTWTCDTNLSGKSCTFDVSVAAGSVAGLTATPADAIVSQSATNFRVETATGTTLDGASFDTAPGGSIVFSGTINGQPMPSLVFYVSDGKTATAPSDPIELVPNAP